MTLNEEDLLEKDFIELEGNTLKIKENLDVNESINVDRNIDADDIDADDIDAWNIDAGHIDALNIDALNIDARDIDAYDIDAGHIDALNIDALNIDARDIDAYDIDARNISYFAFCISRKSLKCLSIEGRKDNSIHKCLDQDIEYKEEKVKKCECCGQKLPDKKRGEASQ